MLDINSLKTFRFQASGFAKVFNGGLRGQVGVRSDPEVGAWGGGVDVGAAEGGAGIYLRRRPIRIFHVW